MRPEPRAITCAHANKSQLREGLKRFSLRGKPFKPLTGKPNLSDQSLKRSNGGSDQGRGQPLIQNGVT
jgi:hypothetical protein